MAANGRMSSPYATMSDLPVFQKRADAVLAPWLKDEPAILSGRGHDPDYHYPCNSQTAPFATFHNVPRQLEYVGPLPEAPWNKQVPVHPTHRGQRPEHQWHMFTSPFATSENCQNQTTPQSPVVVEDAPWDKKLPAQVPGRGSGVHEHSTLPSVQTAPFATNENLEEQKQYEGPMPDAPWDKDQRPAYQQKLPDEYSKNVPYGTSENMNRQEKSTREIDVAPWNKAQPAVNSGKGNEHYSSTGSANSHTAPYATSDNSTTLPPSNKPGDFQAPWDRDEVHYNRLPPQSIQCSHGRNEGPFNAPYAIDRTVAKRNSCTEESSLENQLPNLQI